MASHHSQSLSDPNYLLRLQNMRLTEDAANNPLQVSHRRTSSLNGTVDNDIGLINKVPMPNLNRVPIDDDYKLYDENKFITASKLTGPKAQSPKHQMNVVKTAAANRNNSSSTHSVYENILYYNPSIPVTQQPLPPPPPAYSHYVSNASKTGISSGTYEVIGSRIQSNGSSLNRFTHTPQPDDSDPSHIYENLGNVSGMLFFWLNTSKYIYQKEKLSRRLVVVRLLLVYLQTIFDGFFVILLHFYSIFPFITCILLIPLRLALCDNENNNFKK